MKLKVQHVMDAMLLLSQIIREQRQMPQKGKYRLARMHAKLLPEFKTINAQRDDLITSYDFHPRIPAPAGTGLPESGDGTVESKEFSVPDDKIEEFNAAWAKIGDEIIEVDVEPIPLSQLDLGASADGCIEGSELIVLGELVTE